jgi:hypothetical protein
MLTGGCHCGAVRYEAAETPKRHSICHCTDCRRSAGAPLVAWAVYDKDDVKVTKGQPKMRDSSSYGRRYFCGDCGTGLFYTSDQYLPGLIDIATATLDEPDRLPPPEAQVQTAERIGWAKDLHRLPEFERYPGH